MVVSVVELFFHFQICEFKVVDFNIEIGFRSNRFNCLCLFAREIFWIGVRIGFLRLNDFIGWFSVRFQSQVCWLVGWSKFWSALNSWPYLWFNFKSSERVLITYSSSWISSVVASSVVFLFKYSVTAIFFLPYVLLKHRSVLIYLANWSIARCIVCALGYV